MKSINDLVFDMVPAGLKIVADVSTAHLTREDADRLEDDLTSKHVPGFIGKFAYGYWMETYAYASEMSAIADIKRDIETCGMSESFVKLMRDLCERNIYYVCFDEDGYEFEEFEKFEW